MFLDSNKHEISHSFNFDWESSLPWLLIAGSSLASILGAMIVYLDLPIQHFTKYKTFSFSENKPFVTLALSLSGGILFYSSQWVLLPEAYELVQSTEYFKNYAILFTSIFYLLGVGFLSLINSLIAKLAPEAIKCPCSHKSKKKNYESQSLLPTTPNSILSSISTSSDDTLSETSPLIDRPTLRPNIERTISYTSTPPRPCPPGRCFSSTSTATLECQCEFIPSKEYVSLDGEPVWSFLPIHNLSTFTHHTCNPSNTPGSPPSDNCDCYFPTIVKVKKKDIELHNLMFNMGLQTAVAITLHKLPEGLITVMSAKENMNLSLGLFVGIACHNFPEGFMLAIPIYAATSSRHQAFLFSSIIAGLSQPIGGLIALICLDKIHPLNLQYFNAVLFPATSGVMLAVIWSSFLPAVKRFVGDEGGWRITLPILAFALGLIALPTLTIWLA